MLTSQYLQPTVVPFQDSQVLSLTPNIAPISTTILPQVSTLTVPRPIVQSVVQPLVQPLTQPLVTQTIMAQPLVQPLTQSLVPQPIIAQPIVQPLAQPLIQPAIQPPATPQLIPQPVLSSNIPRPLTPSPTYDKFIPPTPKSTSINPNDGPTKIYQFYQYAPAQQTPLINSLVPQAPMYSTISSPFSSIQNPVLSMTTPQYRTMSLV